VTTLPGIQQLARKNHLTKHLSQMALEFLKEHQFFANTWQLPQDLGSLLLPFSKKKNCTFIIKPTHLCQGFGIKSVNTGKVKAPDC
jgi:hypothetical protein